MISLKIPVAYSSGIEGEIHDFDFDGEQGYESSTPDDVIFGLSFDVGPANAQGADTFQVVVLTPNNRARVGLGEKMIAGSLQLRSPQIIPLGRREILRA